MTKVFTLLTTFTFFSFFCYSQSLTDCANPAPTITVCASNTNAPFAKVWDRTFGTSESDFLKSICQTTDGGFFLAGNTTAGINGDKTTNRIGTGDIWLIKIDASGNKIWDKSFCLYQQNSYPYQTSTVQKIIKTSDNNYLIVGKQYVQSYGSYTHSKYWLLKIDGNGNELWSKTYEGPSTGRADLKTVIPLSDGYLICGDSNANVGGDKTQYNKGQDDFWILKVDLDGNKIWDKTIGGTDFDFLSDAIRLNDGSFLLAGDSYSNVGEDKTSEYKGYIDFWLVKIDANGNKIWDKSFGGTDMDQVRKIVPGTDNTFFLAGFSRSGQNGDKSQASKGGSDFWVVKVDAEGNKIWDKSYGGTDFDILSNAAILADGGVLLYGETTSPLGLDVSQPYKGSYDYWLVKIDTDGNKIWDRRFGSNGPDYETGAMYQIDEKNLLIGGSSNGVGFDKTEVKYGYDGPDFWLLKVYSCEEVLNSASINPGTSVDLIASSCLGTFSWSTGQTTNIITVAPTQTTTYNVSCTIETCVKQSSVQVNVNCSNNFDISAKDSNGNITTDPIVCSGKPSMTLIASGCNGTITWLGGSTGTSLIVSPSATGTFSATCSGNSCTPVTKNIIVTVLEAPTVSAVSTLGCVGDTLSLVASSNIINGIFQWYKNGTAISNATSLNYKAFSTGNYTFGVSKNGCQAISAGTSITINTTIPPKPTISASTLFVCGRGYGTTLTAANCSGTVTWRSDNQFYSPKDGNYVTSTTGNPLSAYIYYQTKFYASCTVNACTSPVSDTLIVDYTKVKVTSPDNIICANGQIQLTAMPYPATGVTSFIWYRNSSSVMGATTNTLTINSPGTYSVEAVYSNGCQPNSGSSGGGGSLVVQNAGDLPVPTISGLSNAFSGPIVKVWDKRFGASGNDSPTSSLATSNQGILVGGTSDQTADGDKSGISRGGNDYWLVKVDSSGNKIWDKSYGSTGSETLQKIVSSSDKGYLLAGSATASPSLINGDKTEPNKTDSPDFWIVKIDSSGNKLWDKVYGGDANDVLYDALRSTDKGYLLGGITSSSASFDVSEASRGNGYFDYWVIKLDSMGNKVWNKRFGGNSDDNLKKIIATNDGGYILGGHSYSGISGDKSEANVGYPNNWIVKINSDGNKVWDKTFGAGLSAQFISMIGTSDGGFLVSTRDTTMRLFKFDVAGNKQWEKAYQFRNSSGYGELIENSTGYLIGANAFESDLTTQPAQGLSDYLVVQTDKNGNTLWDRRFGGSQDDYQQQLTTIKGGYYLIGSSVSPVSGDKSQPRRGSTGNDFWLIKATTSAQLEKPSFVKSGVTFNLIASNCAGTVTWSGGATGTGPMLKVTQTAAKTYTATCNAYGCSTTSSISVGMDLCGDNSDLTITDSITTGTSANPIIKMAQNRIAATNLIGNPTVNASAKYVAGKSITLNPGFKIESGSIFQTKVSPGCN